MKFVGIFKLLWTILCSGYVTLVLIAIIILLLYLYKKSIIGIPKEKHKIIFERFMQVDKSLSRSKEGCGIGLSLVKAFVEMHGGVVSIDSEYNSGSNFILNIPVRVLSLSDEASKEWCCTVEDDKVQIINIEFSDIYS